MFTIYEKETISNLQTLMKELEMIEQKNEELHNELSTGIDLIFVVSIFFVEREEHKTSLQLIDELRSQLELKEQSSKPTCR